MVGRRENYEREERNKGRRQRDSKNKSRAHEPDQSGEKCPTRQDVLTVPEETKTDENARREREKERKRMKRGEEREGRRGSEKRREMNAEKNTAGRKDRDKTGPSLSQMTISQIGYGVEGLY